MKILSMAISEYKKTTLRPNPQYSCITKAFWNLQPRCDLCTALYKTGEDKIPNLCSSLSSESQMGEERVI